MKKALAIMLSVMAAAALAACRTSSQVTSGVSQLSKGVTGMTAEKAAGIYEMTAMTVGNTETGNLVNPDDYVSNTITLGSDGTYSLVTVINPTYQNTDGKVLTGEETEHTFSGTYEIADNGIMTFYTGETDDKGEPVKASIAASDEQIFYSDADGKLIFSGSVIKLEYTRAGNLDKDDQTVKEPGGEAQGNE